MIMGEFYLNYPHVAMMIFGIMLVITGIRQIFIAIKIAKIKHSYVVANKLLAYIQYGALTVMLINFSLSSFFIMKTLHTFSIGIWISTAAIILAFVLVVLMARYNIKSYSIYGVTKSSADESLKAVLNQMRLPFQQDKSGIILTTKNITMQTQMSIEKIKLWARGVGQKTLMKELAGHLQEYYRITPVKPTSYVSVLNILFGLPVMIVGGMIIWSTVNYYMNPHFYVEKLPQAVRTMHQPVIVN